MTKKFKSFNLEDAPVVEENERILESVHTTAQASPESKMEVVKETPESKSIPVAPVDEQPKQPVATATVAASKYRKTKNGIVVDVPMEDYVELSRMKIETGRTLKDLALQAIQEFIQRNKM